jgi:hypothetical protein
MTHGHQVAAKNPREGVGPTAKGQQKRTGREQFFLATKIFFLVE